MDWTVRSLGRLAGVLAVVLLLPRCQAEERPVQEAPEAIASAPPGAAPSETPALEAPPALETSPAAPPPAAPPPPTPLPPTPPPLELPEETPGTDVCSRDGWCWKYPQRVKVFT